MHYLSNSTCKFQSLIGINRDIRELSKNKNLERRQRMEFISHSDIHQSISVFLKDPGALLSLKNPKAS